MLIKEIIEELNHNLRRTVKGYKSMSLCDIESAQTLYSHTLDPDFDIELISACNLEVIKAKLNTVRAMGTDDDIDNIVISLKKEVHFIEITQSKKYFIYLAVDGENVQTDLVKQLLNVYKTRLNEVINEMLVY